MAEPVAIVGAGVTGLALSRHLHAVGVAFRLFEARDRLGGRVLTRDGFDLGPSWFWPGQPRMAALVHGLGLEVFDQHAAGALLFETAQGEIVRNRGFSSMEGSWRLTGGLGALVAGLAAALPADRIETGRRVVSVSADGTLGFADGTTFEAGTVVLAMPPRVAAGLAFDPEPEPEWTAALDRVPTWMAGHAKLVAVYDRPFWRKAGLSGDAMSQRGPLAEVHDASDAARGALFGFVGVPPAVRAGQEVALKRAAVAQLGRLFGASALSPTEVYYKDWSTDICTAVTADARPLSQHPAYGRPPLLDGPWQGRVHVASTELAPEMGGYLEGALAAAEDMAQRLCPATTPGL